jgi:hypothetical protein
MLLRIWQVFWLAPTYLGLPIRQRRTVAEISSVLSRLGVMKLTATGIAPDLHRTSLLMNPPKVDINQIDGKCREKRVK